MNASLVIGVVAGLVVGIYLGAHPRKVIAFALSVGFLVLIGAFYALVIGGIEWLALFLSQQLGVVHWQFGVVLISMIVVGMIIDRLLTEKNNRPSQ